MPIEQKIAATLAERWSNLARRKLHDLLALRQDARWRRYYSDRDYSVEVCRAEKLVDQWSMLADAGKDPDTSRRPT